MDLLDHLCWFRLLGGMIDVISISYIMCFVMLL
jgi:hypothetical protein